MSDNDRPSSLAEFLRDLETRECLTHSPRNPEEARAIAEAEEKLRQMPNWHSSGLWDVKRTRKEVPHD